MAVYYLKDEHWDARMEQIQEAEHENYKRIQKYLRYEVNTYCKGLWSIYWLFYWAFIVF